MANNLFIAYDLMSPGQNYNNVHEKIKSLGNWAQVQESLWFVSSNLSAEQARVAVQTVLDNNDKIIVIEANSAAWNGIPKNVTDFMLQQWSHK